jgi:hypothetical protein
LAWNKESTKIMGNKHSSMSYKLVKNLIVYIYHKYWVKYNNYKLSGYMYKEKTYFKMYDWYFFAMYIFL